MNIGIPISKARTVAYMVKGRPQRPKAQIAPGFQAHGENTIKAEIERLRAEEGLKQAEIGRRLGGLSQRDVSNLLHKKLTMTLPLLIPMRQALRKSVDEILGLPPIRQAPEGDGNGSGEEIDHLEVASAAVRGAESERGHATVQAPPRKRHLPPGR